MQDQFKLEISDPQFTELTEQIEADSKFFAANDLIDYSLLLGVYKRKRDGNLPLCTLLLPKADTDADLERMKNNLVYVSSDKQTLYYICIIDYLTSFKWLRKKTEYLFKKAMYGDTISCIPPDAYSARFVSFMKAAITKIELPETSALPEIVNSSRRHIMNHHS